MTSSAAAAANPDRVGQVLVGGEPVGHGPVGLVFGLAEQPGVSGKTAPYKPWPASFPAYDEGTAAGPRHAMVG
jgi:hypothetical protein